MAAPSSKSSNKPTTMAELLANRGNAPKSYKRGDKVKGVVIEKNPHNLILDIGGKSEGIVAEKAFNEAKDYIRGLAQGDEVIASVIIPETPDGFTILSLRHASRDYFWNRLETAYEKDEEIKAAIRSVSASGVLVEALGITGFIPTSHLGKGALTGIENKVGETLKVKVIELDKEGNRVVLSEKFVSEKEQLERAKTALLKIKEGEVYEGKATTVSDFGAFVELVLPKEKDTKIEGLVHISEMSWEKVGKPTDIIKEGDKVKVKVLVMKGNKLSLSIKQAQDDPWLKAAQKYKKEDKARGRVVRMSDFGAFVTLEPGVEGLVHITKIPPGKKLKEGEELDVYVEDINAKERRLSLGLVLTSKPVGYK